MGKRLLLGVGVGVMVLGMAGLQSACTVGQDARVDAKPKADPVVRERVLNRMEEILAPLAGERSHFQQRRRTMNCEHICELVEPFCDVSSRVCDLAADYPNDEEVQRPCLWADSDCQEARAACRNCTKTPGRP